MASYTTHTFVSILDWLIHKCLESPKQDFANSIDPNETTQKAVSVSVASVQGLHCLLKVYESHMTCFNQPRYVLNERLIFHLRFSKIVYIINDADQSMQFIMIH